MHIRTDYWRFTIFTALGLASNACNSGPSWVSECGESTAKKKEYARYDLAVCSGNGLAHRATNGVACESELPRPDDPASAAKRSEGECKSDTECTEKAYGHCADVSGPGGIPSYHCQYGCVSDLDCDDGQLCNCYSPIGLCVPSDCTQDSDCEDGMLCAEGTPRTLVVECPCRIVASMPMMSASCTTTVLSERAESFATSTARGVCVNRLDLSAVDPSWSRGQRCWRRSVRSPSVRVGVASTSDRSTSLMRQSVRRWANIGPRSV